MPPFQALYARPPPLLAELILPQEDTATGLMPTPASAEIAKTIKANLVKAQERMKIQADKHRSERVLQQDDMVYL